MAIKETVNFKPVYTKKALFNKDLEEDLQSLPIEEIDIEPAMDLISEKTGAETFEEVLNKMERHGDTMNTLHKL